MAFKMKGSAFKLRGVATKSVLKQVSPMKHEAGMGGWANKKWVDQHNAKAATEDHYGDPHGPKPSPAEMKSPNEMKSPLEQTDDRPWWKKGWDEATQIGEGLVEAFEPYKGDYTDSPESIASKFKRGYSKEEKADDPVYQAELLKKKELALANERKIKEEADIKLDKDREAQMKKVLEQSKNWDAASKAKYLDEDGNIKPEHLDSYIW